MIDRLVDRLKFAAPINGSMEDAAPFKDSPPLFIAGSADDNVVPAREIRAIFLCGSKAQLPAELHVYERGEHGFGMRPLILPVDGWTAAYETSLKSHGWLGKPFSTQRPAE